MRTTRHRALVLGRGPSNGGRRARAMPMPSAATCRPAARSAGTPCVVYSVDDQVVVRVPQLHRVTGIFTPEHAPSADAGRQAAIERYLIADDWRALAIADNGPVGLVSGRASEAAAVADALSECNKTGGVGCKLLAVGPFLVAPK